MVEDFVKIDYFISTENVKEDILKVYQKIFSSETLDEELILDELKEGYINKIYKCYFKSNKKEPIIFRIFTSKLTSKNLNEDETKIKNDIEKENDSTKRFTLESKLKINNLFKFAKDSIFDRDYEVKSMFSASKQNLAKPIYGIFNNGMCYGYSEGTTLSSALMLTNDYLNVMSKKLAALHLIELKKPNFEEPAYFDHFKNTYKQFFNQIFISLESNFKKSDIYYYKGYPTWSEINENIIIFEEKLAEIGYSEIGLCHNDLNQKNIIWQPQKTNLYFIDFEKAAPNYICSDIGHHFSNYPGHFLLDFNKNYYPSSDYRLRFVQSYIKERFKLQNKKVDEKKFNEEVKKLFVSSSLFSMNILLYNTMICPIFDLKPEFFQNELINENSKNKKNLGIKFGLKVFEVFKTYKDEIISMSN